MFEFYIKARKGGKSIECWKLRVSEWVKYVICHMLLKRGRLTVKYLRALEWVSEWVSECVEITITAGLQWATKHTHISVSSNDDRQYIHQDSEEHDSPGLHSQCEDPTSHIDILSESNVQHQSYQKRVYLSGFLDFTAAKGHLPRGEKWECHGMSTPPTGAVWKLLGGRHSSGLWRNNMD
jgi:hypothetical protein